MTDDQKFLKHKLQTLLKHNIVEVVFTKVNGDQRRMKCTLDPLRLPGYIQEEHENSKRIIPEDVLPVWDLEKNAWRSFRIDSVLDYLTVKGD